MLVRQVCMHSLYSSSCGQQAAASSVEKTRARGKQQRAAPALRAASSMLVNLAHSFLFGFARERIIVFPLFFPGRDVVGQPEGEAK